MEGARAWFASLAKARKQVLRDETIHPGVSASLDFSWRDAEVQNLNLAVEHHDSAAAFIRKEKRLVSPDTKKAESGLQTLHAVSASPDLEETGIATKQARGKAAIQGAVHQHTPAFEPGFVGLMVSPDPPHAVGAVEDLVDMNGVVQGSPGYHNERVDAGDFIMSINNQDVRRLSVDDLRGLLRGELHSAVEIVLQRKKTMAVYTVKVLRHRKHEYSKPPVAAEPLPTAVKLSDDQVKHAPSQSAIIPGWHKVIDTMGRPYYVNHDTKQWSWEDPALLDGRMLGPEEFLGTPVSPPRAGASAAPPEKGASAAYPAKVPTVLKLQTVQTPGTRAQVDRLGGPLPPLAGEPPPKSPHRERKPPPDGSRPRVVFSENVQVQDPGSPPKQPLTGSVSPILRPAPHVRPPSLGELRDWKSKVNARKGDPARPVPLGADGPPTDRKLFRMNDPPVIFQVAFVCVRGRLLPIFAPYSAASSPPLPLHLDLVSES
jgi:hypothetical protein